MSKVFAFECFADEDVWHTLRTECRLDLLKLHSEGKGRVIRDTLKDRRADIGLVDEDPGSTQPETLQRTSLVGRSGDIELRRLRGRHVLIMRPRLEECFMNSMRRVGLRSQLAKDADELHRVLGPENVRRHSQFRDELKALLAEAQKSGTTVFLTELADLIRSVIGRRR